MFTAREITQDATGANVIVASADGELQHLRASYVVGCDGARSLVREQAGLTQTFSDHEIRMALLVFRSDRLNELLAHFKGKSFFNVLHPELDGYWRFFGRVDTGETWFFHAPVPAGTTRDNFDFHAYLQEVVGAPFAPPPRQNPAQRRETGRSALGNASATGSRPSAAKLRSPTTSRTLFRYWWWRTARQNHLLTTRCTINF